METKEQSGRERPSLSCCTREHLAQCPLSGTLLLLPSRVRSSKRETEPDVRLLPVPVLQLLDSFSSSSVKVASAESE